MGGVKKLETGFKKIISKILKIFLQQSQIEPSKPYSRILFLRYGHIGDMILSLPVFRAARSKYPKAQIDIICDEKNANPLIENDTIDNVFYYKKNFFKIIKLILKLRRKKYDYICNLVAYPSFTFGILARLIGPKAVRAGGDQDQFSYFYNRLIDLPPKMETHMLTRLFKLSEDITGGEIANIDIPWIKLPKHIEEKAEILFKKITSNINAKNPHIVLINLTAGLKRREWTVDNYLELIQSSIIKYKNKIDCWAIVSDPKRPEDATNLVDKVNAPTVVLIPVEDDFKVIMALIQKCYLIITPDTSFSHAASAMGTPVLNLMIGENVKTWAPFGITNKIITSENPKSLEDLSVEKVLNGFDELLVMISSS